MEKNKYFNLKGIKVSLVFPAYKEHVDPVSLEENKRHLGIIPPLSLAYVAAILEKSDCKVQLIDASAFDFTKEQVADEINKFNPDFIGFTSTTIDFHNTLDWIKYIKKMTGKPVIIGGIHLSVYPKETLYHEEIDYGIIGEAEETLPEFLEALVENRDLNSVKGICYRNKAAVVITEKRLPVKNLDECPFPARHLLPNEKYYSLISKKKNFTAMLTSRGCPFRCIFCDNQTISYRYRNPKNIIDEMEQCKRLFNINEIDVFDALFSISPDRVIEICREMRRRKLDIRWSFRTRVDLVTKEMLKELKATGCTRIYYGIESGDENILKAINKKVSMDMIKKVVKLTKDNGIDTFGYFMIGNIGETADSIKKTIKLMLELPLDYVQITPVFAPPNTALYEMLKKEIKKDFWSEYTLFPDKKEVLPRYGTDLKDDEINKYIREAYLKFYMRIGYIFRSIPKIMTFDELIRAAKALEDMIISAYFKRK